MRRFGSQATEDPVWTVIAQKQAFVPTPSRNTLLGQERMTDEQFYDFVQLRGQAIRRRLEGMAPSLSLMPAERAQKAVDEVAGEETTRAKTRIRVQAVAQPARPSGWFSFD